MIGRSRHVRLRNDIEFATPLLIPGLSSRATGPIPFQHSPDVQPEMTVCSHVHSRTLIGGIEQSLLVSAYDIGHRLLANSAAFRSGFRSSTYAIPQVLVIDSGCYEKNGGPPAGQFSSNVDEPLPWKESDYQSTIKDLDDELRPVVVSWDHVGPYSEQISRAQQFLGGRMTLAPSLLLKPPSTTHSFHDFEMLSNSHAKDLRAFDIIGVTERELGESVIDRLIALTTLRKRLDGVEVSSPIHVFGGLDPLYTPLYFAAGGEIFDGLGWLRYAYREGAAMHRDAGILLDEPVDTRWLKAVLSVPLRNLRELSVLTEDLRKLSLKEDWSVLRRGEELEKVFESVEVRTEVSNGW